MDRQTTQKSKQFGVSQMMKSTQVADEASYAAEQATHAATLIILGEKLCDASLYLCMLRDAMYSVLGPLFMIV